ncbi:hypothetical protein KUL42_21100 [Alteromonas sp. KUL42]|nr:hypothetical protein KUL42_21100 [Alteromonas sp. KUL42]
MCFGLRLNTLSIAGSKFFNGEWINLEGFILDNTYLSAIQCKFSKTKESFCGYGIATNCLEAPKTEWTGKATYIQKEGIHDDFGLFHSPDEFYNQKELIYRV